MKKPYRKNWQDFLSSHQELVGWIIIGLFFLACYSLSSYVGKWLLSSDASSDISQLLTTLQDFLTLTLSVVVEATPFLILGIITSSLIRRFLPPSRLLKILPKQPIVRRALISISGMALPVCECGNVPVARSLLASGFKPADVISFLFAAPILNPITIITTMTAFSFEPRMVWWRVIFALLIVQITALIVSFMKEDKVINSAFQKYCENHANERSARSIISSARNEFWQLFTMLVVGAMIAAAIQIFVPRSIINALGTDPIFSVIAMISLGFVVSICSSIDAFFALAYANTFTIGSLLSFLLAGPMIDIKLIMLMKTTFTTRFIAIVMTIIFILSLIIGVGVNIYVS